MTNTLNKEIKLCSEQAPRHLAAVNFFGRWLPWAGTTTLLQPPAPVRVAIAVPNSSLLKTKAMEGQRRRRNCSDIVALFLITRSIKMVAYYQMRLIG